MVRIVLISDVRLYREGLGMVLQQDGRLEVVAQAESVEQALDGMAERGAEAALLDMGLPDARQGIARLAAARPDLKVVAVGLSEVRRDVVACAEAGVAGYVGREASVDELVDTVRGAIHGELHCSPKIAGALLRRVSKLAEAGPAAELKSPLTPRELDIVRLIDRGLTNKAIASRLFIETATVKNHVHNILVKLDAQTRGEAAARVRRLGFLGPVGGRRPADNPLA